MGNKELEELRALVRMDRRARKGPFSPELREPLNTVLKRRWQAGESLKRLARQQGLSDHTVQFWRSHWGERHKRGMQLRCVEVIAETRLSTSALTMHVEMDMLHLMTEAGHLEVLDNGGDLPRRDIGAFLRLPEH